MGKSRLNLILIYNVLLIVLIATFATFAIEGNSPLEILKSEKLEQESYFENRPEQRITEVAVNTISKKYTELSFTESKTLFKDNYIISQEGKINERASSADEQIFNIEKENFFIVHAPVEIKNSNLYLLRYRGFDIDDEMIYIDDEIEKRTKKYIF